MRLGVSSYSFAQSIQSGSMTILDVIDWVAASDADHLELAVGMFGDDLPHDDDLVDRIGRRAQDSGVELANYVVGADFRADDLEARVATVKQHLDVAHRLGITRFRHDIVAWAWRDADHAEYERVLEKVVPICRELADYAAPLGITTTVENHGFFNNNSERVRRLITAVGRPNFRMLLDVGNFLCVDEDPLQAVQLSLPFAEVVHLKDFLIRQEPPASDWWLTTLAGRAILGTIVGFGDLPLDRIVDRIVSSGFTGPMSIEFEGLENDREAVTIGLQTARDLWQRSVERAQR